MATALRPSDLDLYVASPDDQRPVRTLIRVWKKGKVRWGEHLTGDPIALFVDHPGDMRASTCSSYMTVGGHSAADPVTVMVVTRRPTDAERDAFLRELNRIGYLCALVKTVPKDSHTHRVRALGR